MSKLQDWCKEISDVVVAAANGEKIQISYDGKTWADKTELAFDSGYKYRIKPRTIKIGDFDVPEPMRVEPKLRSIVYCVSPSLEHAVLCSEWSGSNEHKLRLSRGMVHSSMEAAKIHAAAIISLTAAE